jgi:hypothetical protein
MLFFGSGLVQLWAEGGCGWKGWRWLGWWRQVEIASVEARVVGLFVFLFMFLLVCSVIVWVVRGGAVVVWLVRGGGLAGLGSILFWGGGGCGVVVVGVVLWWWVLWDF